MQLSGLLRRQQFCVSPCRMYATSSRKSVPFTTSGGSVPWCNRGKLKRLLEVIDGLYFIPQAKRPSVRISQEGFLSGVPPAICLRNLSIRRCPAVIVGGAISVGADPSTVEAKDAGTVTLQGVSSAIDTPRAPTTTVPRTINTPTTA